MNIPDTVWFSLIFFLTGSSLTLIARFHTVKSWVSTIVKYAFPAVAIICFTIALFGFFQSPAQSIVVLFLSIVFGYVSYHYIFQTPYYSVAKLTPKVIAFTKDADKDILKLIGGDFDFFGQTPDDISKNTQFKDLKERGFTRIEILCKWPEVNMVKVRYGKLLADLGNVEIRCYDKCSTDLKIRGRIKKDHMGIEKMLIYQKVRDDGYQAIETDYNEEQCQLYLRIWNALWINAKVVDNTLKGEWINLYRTFN